MCNLTIPSPPAAALSWHRWTPLRRCGCRSGNMKKTEHVPSTGRPSRRGPAPCECPQNCPQISLIILSETPLPLHLSTPGTSASSSINPHPLLNPCQPPALPLHHPEKHTRLCVVVSIFTSFSFASSSPCCSCCRVAAPATLQTFTHRGPSGYLRGQRSALWTYYRPCYTII